MTAIVDKTGTGDELLELAPGAALEVWLGKRLRFGNFVRRAPGGTALHVALARLEGDGDDDDTAGEAEEAAIDAGQVVAIWDAAGAPTDAAGWRALDEDARVLLAATPQSELLGKLDRLWQRASRDAGWRPTLDASVERQRNALPLDSRAVALELFGTPDAAAAAAAASPLGATAAVAAPRRYHGVTPQDYKWRAALRLASGKKVRRGTPAEMTCVGSGLGRLVHSRATK